MKNDKALRHGRVEQRKARANGANIRRTKSPAPGPIIIRLDHRTTITVRHPHAVQKWLAKYPDATVQHP